jgi:NADH-quinone oxidoreductase subunit M
MTTTPWLTVLTFLPLAGAAVLLILRGNARLSRTAAMMFGFIALLMTLFAWHRFLPGIPGMQFEEQWSWVPALRINYHVGIDGLGLLMIVITSIVTLISIAASTEVNNRASLYFALVLALESCLFGAFTALNFAHWFTYWELSLIPAFFLIKLWGGPSRTAAATRFLVYTMVGSIAMLLSFVALYLATGSFDFVELGRMAHDGTLQSALLANRNWGVSAFSPHLGMILFAGVFLGLAVKVPVIPFHTWLPAAYEEAPTGTTILLTGAMSKMGVYGFLRILLPIYGAEMHRASTLLLVLAIATVVLSAFSALAQKDLKRIFAYSSINHLGYCVLGIVAITRSSDPAMLTQKYAALSGVLLQIFSHGLTAATIFWFVALIEQRSGGLRGLDDFGGLRKVAPVFTGLAGIALFSSLGLPGLNGFIGEFLIFKGAFPLAPWAASLCVVGLLITALFILKVLQRVFNGPLNEQWGTFSDLTTTERCSLALPITLMFAIGLFPQLVLSHISGAVVEIVQQLHL